MSENFSKGYLWFYRTFLYRLRCRIRNCFRIRDMWQYDYESCGRCGNNFNVAYILYDKKWVEIYGNDGGCLCVDCLMDMANKKGIFLKKEDFRWLCLFNNGNNFSDIIKE